MATHIEHPGSRHSIPASVKILSRPSASAWFLPLPEPGSIKVRTCARRPGASTTPARIVLTPRRRPPRAPAPGPTALCGPRRATRRPSHSTERRRRRGVTHAAPRLGLLSAVHGQTALDMHTCMRTRMCTCTCTCVHVRGSRVRACLLLFVLGSRRAGTHALTRAARGARARASLRWRSVRQSGSTLAPRACARRRTGSGSC